MAIRIGINGFGRIGKLVFRLMHDTNDFDIIGINDTAPISTLAHLLKYDSAHGLYSKEIKIQDNSLMVKGKIIPVYHENTPESIPRTMKGADIVIESSGRFLTRKALQEHINSGAKKVILTCPSEDSLDKTIIIGINDKEICASDKIVSNASCTANCAAQMIQIMHEGFGIENVFMNTVHPATNNQRLIDAPHNDLRRSRTVLTNIIPTTSTAIAVIHELFPFLRGRFDGLATRVPVHDGSLIEMVIQVGKWASVETVNTLFKKAATGKWKNIVQYTDEPIVSGDIIGNSHSLIFDSLLTKVISNNLVQIVGWYDNEFAYSNRVVELARLLGNT